MIPAPAAGAAPSVAIVLVNWNGWLDSLECVDSLLGQDYSNFHVFLVDNDSTDRSIEHIIEWCESPAADPAWRRHDGVARHTDSRSGQPIRFRLQNVLTEPPQGDAQPGQLTLIRAGANIGFAGGCNVGIRAAGIGVFNHYWMLNTDAVVRRDALAALVARAARSPPPGIIGSTICFYDRPEIVQALGGARLDPSGVSSRLIGTQRPLSSLAHEQATAESQMTYVMGASMLVSDAFVRDVGMMQEDYFLYYEEFDWAMRAKGKHTLGYAPDSFVFHKSGASSSRKMPLLTASFYYRNRIRFVARFFPDRMAAVKRSLAGNFLRLLLKGHWSQARLVLGILLNAREILADVQSVDGGRKPTRK